MKKLKFGSWTYDESAINLQNKSSSGQVDSYIKNGEWFLKGIEIFGFSVYSETLITSFKMFFHIRIS